MADDGDIQLLRDEIARLVTENIALGEQVRALRADVAETRLSDVGRSVAASITRANDTLAAEAPAGAPRWTLASVESEFRGVFALREVGVAFRVPLPEQPVPADQLGLVRLSFRQVPQAGRPLEDAPPTLSESALEPPLRRLQSAAARWPRKRGASGAREIVERSTLLLDRSAERPLDVAAELRALERAAAAFARQTRRDTATTRRAAYRAAVRDLRAWHRGLDVGQAGSLPLTRLADLIDEMVALA